MADRPRYSIDLDSLAGRYYVRDHRTGGVVAHGLRQADALVQRDRLNAIAREDRWREAGASENDTTGEES